MAIEPEAQAASVVFGDAVTRDWLRETPLTFESSSGVVSHAWIWQPATQLVKGVVVVAHGMAEYARRYVPLAHELAKRGMAMAALDHIGHGATCTNPELRGTFDPKAGAQQLIQDVQALRLIAQAKFPKVPVQALGHSMGSFIIRNFIAQYGEGLAGCVVMSTGQQPLASLVAGNLVVNALAARKGWNHRSPFVDKLGVGGYNKRYKNEGAKTGNEWLSRDPESVAAYTNDPDCGFMFSLSGYATLFSLVAGAQNPSNIGRVPKTLPILVIAGDADPVGNYGKAPAQVAADFTKAGVEDVDLVIYPEARHELLNETNREEVLKDVADWLALHI
jgi:alpha-beta hydrolase superfamily lysophospholipase